MCRLNQLDNQNTDKIVINSSTKSRKYRRIKKSSKQEFKKLRKIVPELNSDTSGTKVSHVKVIEETIRYIDDLHRRLLSKIREEGLPDVLKRVAGRRQDEEEFDEERLKHLVGLAMPRFAPRGDGTPFADRSSGVSRRRRVVGSSLTILEGLNKPGQNP